jgi:3-mercaptopyruvate sulfurtransferase SseA
MHVHETNPKKTVITVVIFVLIIIVGFITLKRPKFVYKQSLEETVKLAVDKEGYFEPWQLADVISNVNGNVVLIDIRDKFIFGQGHIPGAENISAFDLTNDKNIEHLNDLKKKGVTVVLYGKDQLEATGPFMWYRMVGFDNVKVLLGGYDYYKAHKNNLAATKGSKEYVKEIARYNYARAAARRSASGEIQSTPEKKPVTVRRRKRATVAAGGC